MKRRIAFSNRMNVRILIVLLILFAVIIVAASITNQNNIRHVYEDNYTERVLLTNSLIASFVDKEDVTYFVDLMWNQDSSFKQRQVQFYYDRIELFQLYEDGASGEELREVLNRINLFYSEMSAFKNDRYWHIIDNLKYLKESSRSAFIYVMADTGLTTHNGEKLYTFIFDAEDDDIFDSPFMDGLGTCDVDQGYLEYVMKEKAQMEYIAHYEGDYGELYYAYAPILDDNYNVIAVLGSDIYLENMASAISASTSLFNLIFIAFFAVALLFIFVFLTRSVIKPLHSLTHTAYEVTQGNINAVVSETALNQRGEIGVLASAMKEANTKLITAKRHFEQSSRNLQTILDMLPIGIWIMSIDDGTLLYSNQTCLKVFHCNSLEQMAGHSGFEFMPEFQPDGRKTIDVVTELGNTDTDVLTAELQCLKLGGEPFSCRMISCTIEYHGRRASLTSMEDITALIETQQMLLNTAQREQEANQLKSRFLANMSHEIRTPMNAILGTAEIQLQKEALPADTEEALLQIYESGDLLLNIINDILDFSKIEAGKLEIIPVKYDIPSLINDSVQLNRLRYESKPLAFLLDLDENTPLTLFGDELRIKQILNNILSNAFKYTDQGEIRLSVACEKSSSELSVVCEENRSELGQLHSQITKLHFGENDVVLVLRISDTGLGMTEEQIGKIFDEYTRFHIENSHTSTGTGLGMSITKRLIDLMDGEIFVESKVGKGSVFTVRLPQKRADSFVCGKKTIEQLQNFHYQSNKAAQKGWTMQESMPYGNVLVVDDVASNLYVAKGMLTRYELKVETASSGFEAIDKLKFGSTYDIIFMDHMMPKMNGIETVKIIRDMGYSGYIVALTANALVGHEELFMQNGFDDYLSKPIDSRELNRLLNHYISDKS